MYQQLRQEALKSNCKRAKVGCLIFSRYGTLIVATHNWSVTECSGLEGSCGCVHAERRALDQIEGMRNVHDCLLVCSYSPCLACAELIVASSKIKTVLYFEKYRCSEGISLLEKQGIYVYHI